MGLMIFPAAIMANTFAMMLVMIGLSLLGKPQLAADFGLVHGATVAVFHSFSGNARSLILGADGGVHGPRILRMRLFMVLPLSALAWALCIGVVEIGGLFVLLLVLRRAAEWLAEVFLSDQEVQQRSRSALQFFAGQALLSLLVLLALLKGGWLALPMTLLWALSPLLACLNRAPLKQALAACLSLPDLRVLLPHFGSSAVIGVSVYVFRVFLLLVAGREAAGDLFSAFAMGGILGAVFSQALGPSMVRQEQTAQPSRLVWLFNRLLVVLLVMGIALGVLVWSLPQSMAWTQKSDFFWLAVACSLVGGAIMVQAQRIRLRIIQGRGAKDVFGSDILANIVLVASVPFLFFGVGVRALVALYLLSGLLSLFFYASERAGLFRHGRGRWLSEPGLLLGLAFLLMLPVFFQLSGRVFVDTSSTFRSGGELARLPLPISSLVCYLGIVLLGRYNDARLALVTLFFLFVGMLFACLLVNDGDRLVLLIQFILPVFALVLGQQYGRRSSALYCLALAGMVLLSVLVPLQLLSTWQLGQGHLSPSVYLFSIYQHLQYVPVMLVGIFLVCLFCFAQAWGLSLWLLVLTALMGAYATYSLSMLAQGFLLLGILGFVVRQLYERRLGVSVAVAGALVLGVGVSLTQVAGSPMASHKYSVSAQSEASRSGLEQNPDVAPVTSPQQTRQAPGAELLRLKNLRERGDIWAYYSRKVINGWKPLLLGNVEIPDRDRYPSAHNHYLDLLYHFGLIGLAPLLVLLAYTLVLVLRRFPRIWRQPELLGLAGVVLFFLAVDNQFKVGLRQPYPGILMFFFWGILLSQLRGLSRSPSTLEQRAARGG